TPLVHFYRANPDATAFDVARLKEALAKALVAFYPLAGRLDIDNEGRTEIICNNEGVLFVVACPRVVRIGDTGGDPNQCRLTQSLLPHTRPPPELTARHNPASGDDGGDGVSPLNNDRIEGRRRDLVTDDDEHAWLDDVHDGGGHDPCGARRQRHRHGQEPVDAAMVEVVHLGTAVHHDAVDGSCFFHFLQTWSTFSRDSDGAAVELPCHDRSLLRPRSPPVVDPGALSVLFPKVTFSKTSGPTATVAFTIFKDQVATLKRLCGGASTLCSVNALVWRRVCVARRLPPHVRVSLSFPANVRRSLRPPLPDRYFGNALFWLGTTSAARDVATESSLTSIARRIADAIARMDDEVVRSAIDYVELAETESRPLKGSMPETDLRITSWLGTDSL
ncbi:hypothetical protein EJB05_28506, partial [Eragrostis curvula]